MLLENKSMHLDNALGNWHTYDIKNNWFRWNVQEEYR